MYYDCHEYLGHSCGGLRWIHLGDGTAMTWDWFSFIVGVLAGFLLRMLWNSITAPEDY